VHQANVDLSFENLGWKLDAANFVASHVPYWNFHDSNSSG